jgi:hypothetical protein
MLLSKTLKKPILSVIALIFVGCATTNLPPAPPSQEMMEQADQVIITANENSQKLYKDFAQYLSSKGFSFKNTNESLMTLQTANKLSQKKRGFRIYYRVNASVIDSTIQLSGIVAYPAANEDEAANTGGKNNEPRVAWNHIVELAKNYPEAKRILYKRN